LEYNLKNGFLFFRISSQIVPFASHPINKVKWWKIFEKEFLEIGNFIKKNNFRISMHPDQFVLINALDEKIVKKSVKELLYHAKVLDALHLDTTAKIQIHVGGVYGDREKSMKRFCENYKKLSLEIRRRLAIENDDVSYSVFDCLKIFKKIKIPIIFDTFHHEVNNNGETIKKAFNLVRKTWGKKDGVPMIDYSSQKKNARKGTHVESVDIKHFKKVFSQLERDFDLMLEIKDKEKSAIEVKKNL
jgi:UV DNA damage endonuclease